MSENEQVRRSKGRGSGASGQSLSPGPPSQGSLHPEASIHDIVRFIQSQMARQTIQMGRLAENEDVKAISDKVEVLATSVSGHTAELAEV